VAVCLLLALGAGSCGGAATSAIDGRGAVKRPRARAALGFGAAAAAPAAATPGMEYGRVKRAAPSESMVVASEEWRREGTRGVFSRWLAFTRSLWLFTRAGARVTYLVRGIVQNSVRKILFAARARAVRAAKIRLHVLYRRFFGRDAILAPLLEML
jgi:hypothetical protein